MVEISTDLSRLHPENGRQKIVWYPAHRSLGLFFSHFERRDQEALGMTKKEIANKISTEMGLPQTVVLEVVRRTFESIIATLESEGRIELRDFGVFKVVTRKARTGRNR